MKKITFLIGACVFTLNTFAGNGNPLTNEPSENYCAKTKNGKLTIMHEGREMTSEVMLANGTKIMMDGTVMKKDGTKMTLKEGQCLDLNGKMMDKSKDKSMDKSSDKSWDKTNNNDVNKSNNNNMDKSNNNNMDNNNTDKTYDKSMDNTNDNTIEKK